MIDGSVLKELRRERGLSQEELGNLVGTEGNVISRWERGTSTPSLHYVHKLSEVLERPVDYLMKGEASDIKERSISENRGSKSPQP